MQMIVRQQWRYFFKRIKVTEHNTLTYHDVPYYEDVSGVFAHFSDLPWAIFLDSGRPVSQLGRYDIFSAYPEKTFLCKDKKTLIETAGHQQVVREDPFNLLKKELENTHASDSSLPFTGGALGFFSYDLGRQIERIANIAADDIATPDLAVGIYRWAYIADHIEKKALLVGDMADQRVRLYWDEICSKVQAPQQSQMRDSYRAVQPIQSNMSEADYKDKFSQVKRYIAAGDCYQINLAQRFQVQVSGDRWQGYQQLRTINPSPYSAFMNTPEHTVLSVSPERFIKIEQGIAETKPIKGTRPRSADKHLDQRLCDELLNSEKDRAENVMIVDLLRNDLSKSCRQNSVRVSKLFAIESFPTVHHLVSTITGELPTSITAIQLLRECFPGGSITGAPKIRAMEIIEELEPHRRGLYCGSIGYIGFNGRMDTNIAIRTLVQKNDQAYFYAGGGLVWDSQADAEYQETYDKASAMFQLFEQ